MTTFPKIWTESGADVESNDWARLLKNWLLTSLASDGTLKNSFTVVNVKDAAYGATGDGVTDDTNAITSAIAALASGRGLIYFPPGNYLVTDTLTIAQDRIQLLGAGKHASYFTFSPSSAKPLFSFTAGASILFQCAIRGFGFIGSGSAQKIAIRATDVSEFDIQDIAVLTWTGNSSIGLQLRGRDFITADRISISADIPISIEDNPNSTIDSDHTHFKNTYLISTDGNPAVSIADGANVTNLTFDGDNAWVGGTNSDGLKWVDTTTSLVSSNVYLRNIRWEQATGTGYMVDIEHNTALDNLILDGFTGGLDCFGIKLRKVRHALLSNVQYLDTANTALDITSTSRPVILLNTWFQAGSSVSASGLTKLYDSGQGDLGGPTSHFVIYDVPSGATVFPAMNGLILTPNGLQVGSPTGGDKGEGTVNASGVYYADGTAGVASFGPSAVASITVKNGLITAIS